MAETVRTDNGSPERVAYDLFRNLESFSPRKEREDYSEYVARKLALYVQCLRATKQGVIDTSGLT